VHHQDPIAQGQQLLHLRCDQQDRDPPRDPSAHQLVDVRLRPDVDASGRLVQEQHARLREQAPRQVRLLLVAAGELPDRRGERGRVEAEVPRQLRDRLLLPPAPHPPRAVREPRQAREADIVRHAEVRREAGALAIAGEEQQAAGDRLARRAQRERPAAKRRAARGPASERAEQRVQHLAGAGALEPGEAEDLAASQRERHVLDDGAVAALLVRHPQGLDGQRRLGGPFGPRGTGRAPGDEIAPHHPAHQLRRRQLLRRRRAHRAAVPQHRDPVGEAVDLLHPVGDVDDAAAPALEPLDPREQRLHLVLAERGGRLVEDEQDRIAPQCASDFEQLPARQRQLRHRLPRRELQVHRREEARGLRFLLLEAHAAQAAPQFPPEEEVVGDAHRGDERELLVDGRDAGADGVPREREPQRSPLHRHGARPIVVHAGEDPDQRALAGAVLPSQDVHLPGTYLEVHAVQHLHRPEGLVDALHGDDRVVRHGARSGEWSASGTCSGPHKYRPRGPRPLEAHPVILPTTSCRPPEAPYGRRVW
jgi:hypothetical protein